VLCGWEGNSRSGVVHILGNYCPVLRQGEEGICILCLTLRSFGDCLTLPCLLVARCQDILIASTTQANNKQGCPKLVNRSQPLVGQSSPYCRDMWRTYCCLTSFFSDYQFVPWLRRYNPTKLCNGAQVEIFGDFFASCIFSEPRAIGFRPAS